MADSFKAKQITSLTENTSMADTDIVPVGNAGTSTLGRIKWANILEAIKSKITSWTYSFNTSSKTLEGAVNEMQGNISAINGSLTKKLDSSSEVFIRNGTTLNANWATRTGIHTTTPNSANAPAYGILLVFETEINKAFNGSNWIYQIWLANSGIVQWRMSINATNGDSWSAWKTL